MADNEVIGLAILTALHNSRPVYADELPVICDYKRSKEIYNYNINKMMKEFKCKTKGELMRKTKSVSVYKIGNSIYFSPSRQEKLSSWSGIPADRAEKIIIPFSSAPAEVGATLRLALDRCIA